MTLYEAFLQVATENLKAECVRLGIPLNGILHTALLASLKSIDFAESEMVSILMKNHYEALARLS